MVHLKGNMIRLKVNMVRVKDNMVRLKENVECLRFDTRVHVLPMAVCRVILLTETACLLIPNIGYGNHFGCVGHRNT